MKKEFNVREGKKGMDILVERDEDISSDISTVYSNLDRGSIKIDISIKSILIILAVIAAIYLSDKLLQIVGVLFFAFIISSAALPVVRKLMNKKVSKGLSIFIVYFVGILLMIGLLTLVFVPLATQTQSLISSMPSIFSNFVTKLNGIKIGEWTLDTQTIQNVLNNFAGWITNSFTANGSEGFKSVFGALTSVAGGILSVITTILLSIYIVIDHDNFVDIVLLRIIDETKRKRVRKLIFDVEDKLGNWLIGQLTLSLIIGFMTWLLLMVAKVPFALPLAVLAGLLESIPNLGPTIAAIPSILFALIAGGPVSGGIVLVGCVIIQQLENSFIVPRVMSNAVGLKPVVVVIAVIAGFTLGGPIGALLSVPVAVLLEIAYQFYIDLQKLKAKGIV